MPHPLAPLRLQLRMHSRIPGRPSGQRAGRYPAEALDLWRGEMLDLYTRYGAEKISDTVMNSTATAGRRAGDRGLGAEVDIRPLCPARGTVSRLCLRKGAD